MYDHAARLDRPAGDNTRGFAAIGIDHQIEQAAAFFGRLTMIFVIVPYQIKSSSDFGLDPKFFPVSLLWLICAMGTLLVATRIYAPPDPPDDEPALGAQNWIFIGGVTAFFLTTFIAINYLGFLLAGTLMIAFVMFVLGLRRLQWLELAGVSIGAPLFIYYSLYQIFSVQLPSGALLP
jgi:hypothetical protein